ncbi:MAG: alpha/beta hydrolase [Anaerolineales bacterium]|nr:MAG: alpha/beta hydrolase [Anaerolineales bacterium]
MAYADISKAQELDIYWPDEGDGPFPVIISIHGGAFRGGDKRDMQLTPTLQGLNRGYAIVSINYRMSGEEIFPALVQDMKAAIRWVRANAAEYMFDSDKIAVWGGSAGGYQALMAGVSEGIDELDDLSLGNAEYSSARNAVVAWFPPTNFLLMDEHLEASGFKQTPESAHSGPESPESCILGQQITGIPDVVHAANPETYVRKGLPPMLIQHGNADSTVPYQGSLTFACKLAAANGQDSVTYEILLNAKHGHEEALFNTPENVNKVLGFIVDALQA